MALCSIRTCEHFLCFFFIFFCGWWEQLEADTWWKLADYGILRNKGSILCFWKLVKCSSQISEWKPWRVLSLLLWGCGGAGSATGGSHYTLIVSHLPPLVWGLSEDHSMENLPRCLSKVDGFSSFKLHLSEWPLTSRLPVLSWERKFEKGSSFF